jgi:hypothetical protein
VYTIVDALTAAAHGMIASVKPNIANFRMIVSLVWRIVPIQEGLAFFRGHRDSHQFVVTRTITPWIGLVRLALSSQRVHANVTNLPSPADPSPAAKLRTGAAGPQRPVLLGGQGEDFVAEKSEFPGRDGVFLAAPGG